jgi:hypothetical protein
VFIYKLLIPTLQITVLTTKVTKYAQKCWSCASTQCAACLIIDVFRRFCAQNTPLKWCHVFQKQPVHSTPVSWYPVSAKFSSISVMFWSSGQGLCAIIHSCTDDLFILLWLGHQFKHWIQQEDWGWFWVEVAVETLHYTLYLTSKTPKKWKYSVL